MDKKKLIEKICEQLTEELRIISAAAAATKDAATNEESKPENQYDTRALEASYLAGAQAHRVREMEAQIAILKQMDIRHYQATEQIGAGAFVHAECNQNEFYFFVLPHAGGATVEFDGHSIQVVTPSSPLGEALVGLKAGDVAFMEAAKMTKEYEIISVQ